MTDQPHDEIRRAPSAALGSPSSSAAAAPSTRSPACPPAACSRAIDRDAYDVVPIGISRDGRWVLAADEPEKLAITGGTLPQVRGVRRLGRARRRPDASAA